MKRMIAITAILLIMLCSCAAQKQTSVTIGVSGLDSSNKSTYYRFDNEDSKALLEILEGYTYDEELCACDPNYKVYLSDGEKYDYGIMLDQSEMYVKSGQKQTPMPAEDIQKFKDIFSRNCTPENKIGHER